MTVPFKVKAVYEYTSAETDDLNFENGQIITVTEEEDEDWYTGEYVDAAGNKLQGIFPRNFVEKYEPAVPLRPNRTNRKSVIPEAAAAEPTAIPERGMTSPPHTVQEAKIESPKELRSAGPVESSSTAPELQRRISQTVQKAPEPKPTPAKQPPAVVEKPTNSSFKDRIAAFNKTTAAPVTPYKSATSQGTSGFVKKAFVAPPPSRNAYVPPPAQPPPQKLYRREEDPSLARDEDEGSDGDDSAARVPPPSALPAEDQPKPTSLKDRIALLQQQQLEQAARNADKKKSKKPPIQRTESAETVEEPIESTEAPLSRRDTGDTLGRASIDARRGDNGESGEPSRATTELPTVPPPSRELMSDTNDADDSGEADEDDGQEVSTEEEKPKSSTAKSPPQLATESHGRDANVEDEEDTEDEDPEIRRRRELRERMAKMSGGMGMPGMFNPLGGMPPPSRKPKSSRESDHATETSYRDDTARAPPVPIMALPGMSTRPRQPEPDDEGSEPDETEIPTPINTGTHGEQTDDYIGQPQRTATRSVPQSPNDRAVPATPARDTRAVPPLPPIAQPSSPPPRAVPPPPPGAGRDRVQEVESPAPAPLPRGSLDRQPPPGLLPSSPTRALPDESAPHTSDKRASRAPPPPVPATEPGSLATRPPPPLPPSQPPSRSTSDLSVPDDGDSEAEVTEYDGDYDTDIASSAKHKDALKSHNRGSSLDDEELLTDDATTQQPPRTVPPPLPPNNPPRDLPPPLPQSSTKSRKSMDVPRAGPPPVPTTRPDDDEYDPYRYSIVSPKSPIVSSSRSPPLRPAEQEYETGDMYGSPPPASRAPPPPPPSTGPLPPVPVERSAPPPPPPTERSVAPPPPLGSAPANPLGSLVPPVGQAYDQTRQSSDLSRQPTVRRSVELSRASADYGSIASDLDLGRATSWWTHNNVPPPALQGRSDVLFEIESNTTSKRGGKTTITRDIYVLWMDYSQTTINVAFDPADAGNPSFQQSHQRPPPPPRQDQLESASEQLGSQIIRAAEANQGKTSGDGLSYALVQEILQPLSGTALMPIGTRSYGALIYANLANASVQQHDAIRPGDIITFRNAKFAGHKGGLHAKYSMDVGKPDHVGIVIDWDGTKKKIRAWEQGREESKGKKSKVKEESFRMGDLKSGEVRVWRVMPRAWVGWDKS